MERSRLSCHLMLTAGLALLRSSYTADRPSGVEIPSPLHSGSGGPNCRAGSSPKVPLPSQDIGDMSSGCGPYFEAVVEGTRRCASDSEAAFSGCRPSSRDPFFGIS